MTPGLYVVGTPIGNLRDITLRALDTLREATVILTEDTRHTGGLLAAHGIRTAMLSCHKFNEASRAHQVVSRIQAGEAVALVTDSGMPAISDPGARTVRACREAGLPVAVVPGPSAVTAAIALGGLTGHSFVFEGFLERTEGARRRRLTELGALGMAVVLYESPFRLLRLFDDVEAALGPRRLLVCRELTKKFEEVVEGTPAEVRAAFAARTVKGELVVVLAPPERAGGRRPD